MSIFLKVFCNRKNNNKSAKQFYYYKYTIAKKKKTNRNISIITGIFTIEVFSFFKLTRAQNVNRD